MMKMMTTIKDIDFDSIAKLKVVQDIIEQERRVARKEVLQGIINQIDMGLSVVLIKQNCKKELKAESG